MKYLVLFVIVSLSSVCTGQNLVPNPSFEEYSQCPFSTSGIYEGFVDNWYSWSESPDFFHACSNDIDGFAGVPENAFGYQNPMSGDGYAGLVTFTLFGSDLREYMAVELIEPLDVGEEYYIVIHASRFDGGGESYAWCATNHIGLRFFLNPTYNGDNNPLQPDNFAHLDHDELLTDTVNWTQIDTHFIADQPYNWIAIGNFFDDDNTQYVIENETESCFGIYYIENVCIATNEDDCDYLISSTNSLESIRTEIDIFPNPATTSIKIVTAKSNIKKLQLINMDGRLISNRSSNNREVILDTQEYSRGIYILRIHFENKILNEKIILK